MSQSASPWRTGLRWAIIGIIVTLAFGTAAGPAMAQEEDPPPPDGNREVVQSPQFSSSKSIKLDVRRDNPSQRAAGSTPPQGGCDFNTSFPYTANYYNNVLEDVDFTITGSTTCNTTAPAQTNDEMTGQTTLQRNNANYDSAAFAQCDNVAAGDPPCTFVVSAKQTGCFVAGAFACDGTYRTEYAGSILLPAGWQFNSAPAGCTLLGGGREMLCVFYSTSAYVRPLYA